MRENNDNMNRGYLKYIKYYLVPNRSFKGVLVSVLSSEHLLRERFLAVVDSDEALEILLSSLAEEGFRYVEKISDKYEEFIYLDQ